MMKRPYLLLLIAGFMLGSCELSVVPSPADSQDEIVNEDPEDGDIDEDDPSGTGNDSLVDVGDTEEIVDLDEFTKTIDIVWNGSSASITNGTSLEVAVDGGHVTVGTPDSEGQKVRINLSGSSTDGSLKIYNGVKADDTHKKLLLSFNGLALQSGRGPALNIQSGKTAYLLLGSENSLSDCASYSAIPDGEDAKGCIFSEEQLVFLGDGSLSVSGLYKHAICSDDYITFIGGELEVVSAASDGIHTNGYVRVDGGKLNINSQGEGIQCEKAEEGFFYMTGGCLAITSSGDKSGGIETAADILIDGGILNVSVSGNAAKCLKSDNNICITGGSLDLHASGGGLYDTTEKDAKAAACIKAENIVTLEGGVISCRSTGNGGKGINCYRFICNDPTRLSVNTSGSTYNYSSQTCRPKAVKATDGVQVNGGNIEIETTGTEGEGLESKSWVEINGGKVAINAKDDGINAATTITFNGGYTYVYSTANDGIDSNYNKAGSIVFNGGVVIAHSAGGPENGFDADSNGNLSFNGGMIFCTGGQMGGGGGGRGGWGGGPGSGGSGSSPACEQLTYSWTGAAKVGWFTIADNSGKVIMSCYIPRALSSNFSLISAPLEAGTAYQYGILGAAPAGATEVFGQYFYDSGTATGLTGFTAGTGYLTL
ncbi:MAG: carbohydrate-binding domain-containing protein [Candidatus Cryptobacteroides sp.]